MLMIIVVIIHDYDGEDDDDGDTADGMMLQLTNISLNYNHMDIMSSNIFLRENKVKKK